MKTFLILAIILFIAANLFPQSSIIIHKNDGSGTTVIKTNIIDSIKFCPASVTYSGKTYNTIVIGSQCWLKENLDVGTRIDGAVDQTNNSILEKYCYGDISANCTTYGGLYQWNEAMQYVTTAGIKGICPTGWHIPRNAEFTTLSTTVGGDGNSLKAVGQGSGAGAGTNTSGFSALLAGFRDNNQSFTSLTLETYFWSSSERNPTVAYYTCLVSNDINLYPYFSSKEDGFSVRCTKD